MSSYRLQQNLLSTMRESEFVRFLSMPLDSAGHWVGLPILRQANPTQMECEPKVLNLFVYAQTIGHERLVAKRSHTMSHASWRAAVRTR